MATFSWGSKGLTPFSTPLLIHENRLYKVVSYLLARIVWALAGSNVVSGPVKWYRFASFAFAVVHWITFFDFDVVNLDGTSFFATHDYFGTDYLSCGWEMNI